MSLLLQALKRAEETKRQRENSSSEPIAKPEGNHPEVMEELSFPALEETTIEPTQTTAITERIEPVFSPIKIMVPAETPEPLNLESVSTTPVNEIITLEFEGTAAAPQPAEASAPIASEVKASTTTIVPPPPPEPAPLISKPIITPIAEPATPNAARQLLSAPRAKSSYRTLPWLVLGGCILLGGIGAWFWWQINQINIPTAPVTLAGTPAPEASAPSSVVINASEPALSTPVVVAAASAAVARPAMKTPSTASVSIKPSTVSRPLGNDAAAYIENVPAPGHLPTIERRTQEAAVPAPLEAAWQAYQKGDFSTAEAQYQRMLSIDARNRDAHLGLAAIAIQRGKKSEAATWYKKILVLNPQDDDAHAGLATVDTSALSERAEARLLQQTERPESPRVLGQFYAANNRWHEAQEQYFIAFSREPNNADLAFNLAISLDHISQTKLASDYYRKALTLGRGSFDRKAVERRLAEIGTEQK